MKKDRRIIKKILDTNFGITKWSTNALELILLYIQEKDKLTNPKKSSRI